MKIFMILNGTSLKFIQAIDRVEAKHSAINTCDHSKEIIVREVEEVKIGPTIKRSFGL